MSTLYIVSTPIGNLEDITIRAIKTLFSVNIIACEDTRRTGLLLQELKKRYPFYSSREASSTNREAMPAGRQVIQNSSRQTASNNKTPILTSYYDEIEQSKTPEIIELLEQGKSVALISDAGTPLINDPGYRLVSEAQKRGIKVESVPGPSAVIAALSISGLPANQFTFLGYPPEKTSHRIKLFESLVRHPERSETESRDLVHPTYILYCAPHKFEAVLQDMRTVFGDKEITIARELTKIHEEVWHGKLKDALQYFKNPQGEFVFLFALNFHS